MNETLSNEEKILKASLKLTMDMQYAIQSVMNKNGVSQKKLAELMECSPSNVSQMLSDDANPRIETIAKALTVLGEKFAFISETMHGGWLLKNYKNCDAKSVAVNKVDRVAKRKDLSKFFADKYADVDLYIPKNSLVITSSFKKANDNGWLKDNESIRETIEVA